MPTILARKNNFLTSLLVIADIKKPQLLNVKLIILVLL